MFNPFSSAKRGYLDRVSTKQQISLLLAMLIGGVGLVALVATAAVNLIRGEILHLSGETAPTQLRLAKLERGFEQINDDFAHISLAGSTTELAAVQSALEKTLDEVRSISAGLGSSAGFQSPVIQQMRQTGEQLSRIARQRIEARDNIQRANRKVTREIEDVTSRTQNWSAAMSALRDSSQKALLSSQQTSFEANSTIRKLLTEREQLAQLRACVREVGAINDRFHLNVIRGTSDSILDTMTADTFRDKQLASEVQFFVDRFTGLFGGPTGLLAARAAVLSSPADRPAQLRYQGRQAALAEAIERLSGRIAEEIDPLDLAVLKTNAAMNQATALTARVSSVSATVEQIDGHSRFIQALAWRFLAERDLASVDRIAREVADQTAQVHTGLHTLEGNLSAVDRSASLSSLNSAHQAFARVSQLLIGPSGVANAVKASIAKQQEAEMLLRNALESIHRVALAGSIRAGDAEAAENRSLIRIQRLAAGTFFLVGLVSFAALLAGSVVGGRVRKEILNSENRQLRLRNELRERALHDPLTDLPNRLLFHKLMEKSIEEAAVAQTQVAVFCVDLDRFKQVNDRLGHRVGDLYLIEVAQRMRTAIGSGGIVARVGGDEFTVLLPNGETEHAIEAAQRLLKALSEPAIIENCPVQSGCSIGIARFPSDGADPETLLKNADQAMYRAKNSGRNRFSLFDWQVSKSAQEDEEIQELLRIALRDGGFHLKYQPQFSLDGRVPCLEALLRLHHPQHGNIPPGRFIPIAEESGLIVPIGEWVMREAVRQSLEWRNAGLRPVRIGVNVSALQFAQADFYDSVRQLLDQSGFAPELLELEITETLVMSHLEETHRLLVRLRALGLQVSIDDFGTGYSSLSYLHKLPVDTIKIDQSFIRDLHNKTSTLPLIQAITSAAHAFGLSVVAEGVETSIQMQALADLGCDRMQGYLFARPLAVEEVVTLLTNQSPPALPFQQGQRRLALSHEEPADDLLGVSLDVQAPA